MVIKPNKAVRQIKMMDSGSSVSNYMTGEWQEFVYDLSFPGDSAFHFQVLFHKNNLSD